MTVMSRMFRAVPIAVAVIALVVVSLHDALRRELTHALAQGGPAFAIKACHIDVAGLTRRMGGHGGITAGRTSDRLRNPANAPPAWAASLVAGPADVELPNQSNRRIS